MIVRVQVHPDEPTAFLLAFTPPEWSQQTMGKFQAARWLPDRRAYAVPIEQASSFFRFVNHYGAEILDERRQTTNAVRRSAPECANCAQPATLDASTRLRNCPGCGQPWAPVVHELRPTETATTRCTSCGQQQHGRFPYCTRCGSPMHYPTTELGLANAHAAETARTALKAPQTLAESLGELHNNITQQETLV